MAGAITLLGKVSARERTRARCSMYPTRTSDSSDVEVFILAAAYEGTEKNNEEENVNA